MKIKGSQAINNSINKGIKSLARKLYAKKFKKFNRPTKKYKENNRIQVLPLSSNSLRGFKLLNFFFYKLINTTL